MRSFILLGKVANFLKNNEINMRDIWRNIEHVTHLTAQGEISIDDAERYTYMLFRLAEELEP